MVLVGRRARLFVLGLAGAWAGCASAPPAPPPVLAGPTRVDCPLPLVWASAAETPRRVRITNPTDRLLTVVVDRCFNHTLIDDVPPGTTIQPVLPRRLIAYPEGIRFHAFDLEGERFVGSWHVAAEPKPLLELVLDTTTRVAGDLFYFDVKQGSTSAPMMREGDDGEDYVMLPDVGGGGFLIWSCGEGRRWLSLSTGLKLGGDSTGVRVAFDRVEFANEPWPILQSLTDAVLAPEAQVDPLTTRAAAARLTNFTVATATRANDGSANPRTVTYGFRTDSIASRIETLPCFAELGL
jgi:hypothetical protein